MARKLKVDILISTIDQGIEKVKDVLLAPRNDVYYIIVHQYRDETYNYTPRELVRDDTLVLHISGSGVTKSRNRALALANGDIGLFSDDDVTYTDSYIDTIQRIFVNNSDLDIGLFKIKCSDSEKEYKDYPIDVVQLEKPAFSVGTIEIAFRVNSVRNSEVCFDERFGAGNEKLPGSDENIFIIDCIRSGLNVIFYPEYVVEHPYVSTVKMMKKYDKKLNWVVGGYDCRVNGSVAVAKAIGATIKLFPDLIRNKVNPLTYLFHRLSAVFFILFSSPPRSNH